MIEIKIYTIDNGVPERQQVMDSLSAIGFVPVATLSVAPRSSVEFEVSRAADMAADEPVSEDKPKASRGRPKKETPKPDAPADPAPAEAAQDAADEKAEQEAAKPAPEPEKATVYGQEDMRAAGKAYADAFGMDACLADMPGIIGHAAFKLVPEDQYDEVTRKILSAIEAKKKA